MFGSILKSIAPSVGKLIKGKAAKSIAIGASGPTALMVVLEWWPGLADATGDKPVSYSYVAAATSWAINLLKLWAQRIIAATRPD